MDVAPPFRAYRGDEPYAFVSYAHADALLVYDVIGRLQRDGYRIWYDEGIEPATEWPDEIARALEGCSLFVAFVSPVSVNRRVVHNEVMQAAGGNKPMLMVLLEPTDLPSGFSLLAGHSQSLRYYGADATAAVAQAREAFERHGVTPSPEAAAREPAVELPPTTSRMPPRARPHLQRTVPSVFADRVPQSAALLASVDRQIARLREDEEIEEDVFPNVLVFYGGGGVGKSGLSRQLELWVSRGELGESAWDRWPHPAAVAVRWDFHESAGNIDLVRLLISLRKSLIGVPGSWAAFDLALATYLEAVRAGDGEGGGIGVAGAVEDALLRSLKRVASEMSSGIPPALTPAAVRYLAREAVASSAMVDRYDGLAQLLEECGRIPSGSQAPGVVADLLYVLTQEIYFVPPQERPALIFFADHFEKVQRVGGPHEGTIAGLIAAVPYALFVITGRDRLNWTAPHRTDLPHAGERAWPGLAAGASVDPRQHLLGPLSDEDTLRIYETNRAGYRWRLGDDVIDALVKRSAGLPLHVEAVLQLARNLDRNDPGIELTEELLAGELPTVVQALLQALDRDEADAFRAACVLPSFDVPLASAVGRVPQGTVERAIRYALVDDDAGGLYPYRVHDEIRRLVQADRQTAGYWADGDWLAAATLGLQEAMRRVAEGHAGGSDQRQIEATALALRLAYEWDIYEPGLTRLVHDGPTVSGLAPLIPIRTSLSRSPAADLIALVHALALPFPEAPAALAAIGARDPEVRHYIDRWRVYRLRSTGSRPEALALLGEMIERDADHRGFLHHQYAVTLRNLRRYADSLAHAAEHRPDNMPWFSRQIERAQGVYDGDYTIEMDRAASQPSRRFRLELEVSALDARARSVGVTIEEVNEYLQRTIDTGQRTDQRRCLKLLTYFDLGDADRFENSLARVVEKGESYGSIAPLVPHLLALRAMYTGRPDDGLRAHHAALDLLAQSGDERGEEWIPVEFWLAELGHALPDYPTQWALPEEQVRDNWLAVARGIIARGTVQG